MRQTSRVTPPSVGIASVPISGLPLVNLDVDDLSNQEAVSGPELSALGSAGQHPKARRHLNPSFENFEL